MKCCATCQHRKKNKLSCEKYKALKPWRVIVDHKFCKHYASSIFVPAACDPLDAYLGFAIGDAMGVPVEFLSRKEMKRNPVTDMEGHGAHMQPPGVWSDDTSLLLANSHALTTYGYDPEMIANEMIEWMDYGKYSATGTMFGLGDETRKSLDRIKAGYEAISAGGIGNYENGNGSLMRILPMAYFLLNCNDFEKKRRIIFEVSSITHRNLTSKIACHFLLELVMKVIETKDFEVSYKDTCCVFSGFYEEEKEGVFKRIFSGKIGMLLEREVKTSSYVIDTLEAVLWCIANTDNYKNSVIKAINLGGDTDTIGAIVGGIAGIIYGKDKIPQKWVETCANKKLIKEEAWKMKELVKNFQL